jgi:hypothetical protein
VNGGYEPVLHALAIEPRVASPGERVRLVFRTPNLGATPSPSATVRFLLPEGLEPLDEPAVRVESAAPGEALVAVLSARVASPQADGARLVAHAALELDETVLGTNRCVLAVRARAILDAERSGVWVEAAGRDRVRVRGVVANDGDGAARDVVLVVPAPHGTTIEDGGEDSLEIARLEPGACASVTYEARIVAPAARFEVDAAYVRVGETRYALPSHAFVEAEPHLAPPQVVLVPGRRRVDVTIDVHNEGWSDARDVAVRVALPAPLRILVGSLVVDGLPLCARPGRRAQTQDALARVQSDRGVTTITVRRIAARGAARIALASALPAGFDEGTVEIGLGLETIAVPLVRERVRDVRVRIVDAPATLVAGESVAIVAELTNAGDLVETLALELRGPVDVVERFAPASPLNPGAVVTGRFVARIRDGFEDGAALSLAVVALDGEVERARDERNVLVRDRPWLALDARVGQDERVRYTLRNVGTTESREVLAIVGDEEHAIDRLAPGACTEIETSVNAARIGGVVRVAGREMLAVAPLDVPAPPTIATTLSAPSAIVAGSAVAVCLRIAIAGEVETLVIRVPALEGASYVAGSTTVDGRALLDRASGSPLADPGLVLRGVPAGTDAVVRWSLLVTPELGDAALTIGAALVVDGTPREVEPVLVEVRAGESFAARPNGFAYHIDARAVDVPPQIAEEMISIAPPASDDVTPPLVIALEEERRASLDLRLRRERCDEIARLLECGDERLVSHLIALRALFPDDAGPDLALMHALTDAREALRDVFDRLFVKLRIPGFDVTPADLEDEPLRSAIVALLNVLVKVRPELRSHRMALVDAPYGAPAMVRTLTALVAAESTGDSMLDEALQRYVRALDARLARYDENGESFEDALCADAGSALSAARSDLLATLRGRTPVLA